MRLTRLDLSIGRWYDATTARRDDPAFQSVPLAIGLCYQTDLSLVKEPGVTVFLISLKAGGVALVSSSGCHLA
jgi:hypothetical protein